MSGPQLYLTTPSSFSLLPDSLPHALPPPVKEHSFRAPFGIDPWLYNFALKPEIPATFALLYVATVFTLNAYNRKRNHKPWWISRQRAFRWFVVAHNAILTLYSAATFLAMFRAIVHTWPGLNTHTGVAGVADALCKIHGPRGLGDATTYNTTINIWETKNALIKLGYDGNPDPSDVGRLWNEGLAFWGWMFYVSKFYEVLDTLIILAKGKRSATLQTYHHSGAMLCMWAGIRYMSPPIWMFVFVNSFIHALMYTYFTLSAVGVKVPTKYKRTLTSMQIAQFVWGASYAAAHLFVQYDIPVSTPYQVAATVQQAASSVSSAASAATSTVSKVIASPAASGTLVALVKKLLLRAVGEEGIAERVTNNQGQPITPHIEEKIEKVHEKLQQRYETRYRTDYTKVNCIDTTGEAFAIYLNLLYLAPLTFLFLRFFVKAYTGRSKPRRASHAAKQITDSGKVAGERTSETVEKLGRKAEDEIIEAEAELQKLDGKDIYAQFQRDVKTMKDGTFRDRRVSDHVQNLERQVKSAAESVKERTKQAVSRTGSPRRASPSKKQLDVPRSDFQAPKQESNGVVANDDAEKQAAAQEAVTQPQESSQPEQKQDETLATSDAIRPGAQTEPEITSELEPAPQPAALQADDASYAEVVKEGTSTTESSDFTEQSIYESRTESESHQDESVSTSQGDSVFGLSEDTDAMGKSGAIIDYVTEKADEVKEEVKYSLSTDSSGASGS